MLVQGSLQPSPDRHYTVPRSYSVGFALGREHDWWLVTLYDVQGTPMARLDVREACVFVSPDAEVCAISVQNGNGSPTYFTGQKALRCVFGTDPDDVQPAFHSAATVGGFEMPFLGAVALPDGYPITAASAGVGSVLHAPAAHQLTTAAAWNLPGPYGADPRPWRLHLQNLGPDPVLFTWGLPPCSEPTAVNALQLQAAGDSIDLDVFGDVKLILAPGAVTDPQVGPADLRFTIAQP